MWRFLPMMSTPLINMILLRKAAEGCACVTVHFIPVSSLLEKLRGVSVENVPFPTWYRLLFAVISRNFMIRIYAVIWLLRFPIEPFQE